MLTNSLWHSGTTDSRGNQLADSVSNSSFAVLNTNSPTRLPGNADFRCIISIILSHHLVGMANTHDHELRPSAHTFGLQTTATSSPARHRTYINTKKADWTGYRQEIERKLSSRHFPTDCQKDEKWIRTTLLKAASHHIPTGRRNRYTKQVPAEILAMMEERDDLRKQDSASPRLSTMNDEITKATSDHKRRQWREFAESIDHRTDRTKLGRTIKGIDGKSKQTAENEGITFTGRSHTSPKLIANSFNRQFTTSFVPSWVRVFTTTIGCTSDDNDERFVIADDTNVFVLLLHFKHADLLGDGRIYMESLYQRGVIDIAATVEKNRSFIPALLAAHALSGWDIVATYYGIGKVKVLKSAARMYYTVGSELLFILHVLRKFNLSMKSSFFQVQSHFGFWTI